MRVVNTTNTTTTTTTTKASSYGSVSDNNPTISDPASTSNTNTNTTTVDAVVVVVTNNEGASIGQVVASLTKNLIGCGALSLSKGIALSTNNLVVGVGVGLLWIILFGIIFGYYCWLIGKICYLTNNYTYRSAWQKSVGNQGSVFVSSANSLKASLAILAYASILTDTTLSLLTSMGYTNSISHTTCLLVITIVFLVPLCLLKNIKVLAPFSLIGTGGIVLTTIAMFIRWYDGSYQVGGVYYHDLQPQYQPYFGSINNAWSADVLPYVCMVYESFVMHYNSPRFYRELRNHNLQRYNITCTVSFGIAGIMYGGIACFGYMTFGGNSSSFILNNYSPYDPLATFCRIAVGLSTVTAYPIVFMGVRDGVFDIWNISLQQQQSNPQLVSSVTLGLLFIVTIISIFVHDLGLINAVGGGLVATAIVFVFPTIMFQSIVMTARKKRQQQQQQNELRSLIHPDTVEDGQQQQVQVQHDDDDGTTKTDSNNVSTTEGIITIILAIIGVILGLVGAYIAVIMAERK